ncbi:MAG: helicase-related protein, partial [Rhodospirillaceae bacterium]
MERMLGHESGMMGFPLRLLARENYDRAVAIKGAAAVALVTGEEKIVPATARYFICTVESMPVDRDVAFLAVDEIQLASDRERGHIFTDRLLHARGRLETMFLGSETVRPLIRKLVPGVNFVTRPRFSKITYSGSKKLTRLPRRSAVVAFSVSEVYGIADLLRRQRGGTAVVMGALSPRTRNAQVALYQSGEVDYLVATDAIGMGLNMDVDHVAFAALSKFDGRAPRPLTAPELSQIAGRAGRHMNDGTFGVTAEAAALDSETIARIETHEFQALKSVYWRNTDLRYVSVQSLLSGLKKPPPSPGLIRPPATDDQLVLEILAQDSDIQERAKGQERVRLLWDTAQVP